jgi:hypothetical protein
LFARAPARGQGAGAVESGNGGWRRPLQARHEKGRPAMIRILGVIVLIVVVVALLMVFGLIDAIF